MKIGIGYDVHKLVRNTDLIVGGVKIEHEKGLLGHSDADVLTHAIMDSILGALSLGDIGKQFPDTSPEFKDANSINLLKKVYESMYDKGYIIGNIDAVIVAQRPKMAPYIIDMRKVISDTLNTSIENINIKATTTEELGFEGRKEGISSHSVCLLIKK